MKRGLLLLLLLLGCAKSREPDAVPLGKIPGHESLPQDLSSKEAPRLMPAETYVRSYLQLFGGLAPLEAQTALQGSDAALFSGWYDYLTALGLPDYRNDLARRNQTNAMMLATLERVGLALCTRAAERELHAAAPLDKRAVFAFEQTAGAPTEEEFAARFDVLHRTFLGYPARQAPGPRVERFYKLYTSAVARHATDAASPLTPAETGWVSVCSGLIRHPEFNAY